MVLGDRLDSSEYSSLSLGFRMSRADNARRDEGDFEEVCDGEDCRGTNCRLEVDAVAGDKV